jgi:hypothetical protein
MSSAVCDQEAFYPLRSLVEGPLTTHMQLDEAERFVRTVVLHDEIWMELEPWAYHPDSEPEWTEEEKLVGARNVFVAVGPVLDGYHFFAEKPARQKLAAVELSSALIETSRQYSNADLGNPYYKAHVEYLQRIVDVLQNGGSALLAGRFGSAAIDASRKYPDKLFETLDADWQQLARDADAGDVWVSVPPVLSIILTRCARRDAIPSVLEDLRAEFADARAKVWSLLRQLKTARTIAETIQIRQELTAASRHMSLAEHQIGTRPLRVLWEVIAGGASGAATALISGGDPRVGVATGAVSTGARSIPALIAECGPALFSRGAFDLANRVRRAALQVEYDALARLLSDDEMRKLSATAQQMTVRLP